MPQSSLMLSLPPPPPIIWAGCCSSSPEEVYRENDANNVSQVQLRHDVGLVGTLKTEKWMVEMKEKKRITVGSNE